METVYAFICDYAQAAGGKVNALGIGFDTIHAATVPTTHRQFFLVGKFNADAAEAGEKSIRISLIDADGRDAIQPIEGRLTLPRVEGATESFGNLTVGFDNVQFQVHGDYALHVVVEGHTLIRIPIRVAPPPAVPDGTSPRG